MNQQVLADRSSALKTTLLALCAGAAFASAAALVYAMSATKSAQIVEIAFAVIASVAISLAVPGCIVLHRLRRIELGAPDLFLESNLQRRELALEHPDGFRAGILRRFAAKAMLGHDFMVGDEIEIRSLEEIRATLDGRGCLDGLPFQAEMARFCGRQGRVFRSIDKIYDYGRTRLMRRLEGCVLVTNLRCDGSQHGDCQASCYMIWKAQWLRRPGERQAATPTRGGSVAPGRIIERASDGAARERFMCQFTELHAASSPMAEWEIGKEVRPLVAGNVTLVTWIVGLGTRCFNLVQQLRGGVGFPQLPKVKDANTIQATPLAPGDTVMVRPITEIASTLNDKGKHRGLWFDGDQIKHCGRPYKVLARVDRIIDDVHGQMLMMKTPCILLEGVDYSGERLSFNAQHDLFFWREVWLEKKS